MSLFRASGAALFLGRLARSSGRPHAPLHMPPPRPLGRAPPSQRTDKATAAVVGLPGIAPWAAGSIWRGICTGASTAALRESAASSAAGRWVSRRAAWGGMAVGRAAGSAAAMAGRAGGAVSARGFKFQSRPGGGFGGFGFGRSQDDSAVFALIAANVAVYLAWQVMNRNFMAHHFLVSGESIGNLRLYTALTAAFSHTDMGHLFANMLGLYFFGTELAALLGGPTLIWLYVTSGIVGSACQVLYHQERFGRWNYWAPPCLGASGAVNAVVALNALFWPRRTILLYFFIPVPAAILAAGFIGKDFIGIVSGGSR
eukprot:CAMPEP_0182873160 /NCGR_PEP_ID=MMETSP0034_2-20130328/12157_1 /TAXON_ID=156128 /ORGANISM="Nephroselmis pyriformis, Strain CCMP717" /LENGTH=313 /DNA_ID=CAMNT_0025005791 /DNA_START=341 /DNA_END=1278 /DNA_ORIENTATION=+